MSTVTPQTEMRTRANEGVAPRQWHKPPVWSVAVGVLLLTLGATAGGSLVFQDRFRLRGRLLGLLARTLDRRIARSVPL